MLEQRTEHDDGGALHDSPRAQFQDAKINKFSAHMNGREASRPAASFPFIVADEAGEPLVAVGCVARALNIMNRLDGAARVQRDDGTLLARRCRLDAPTITAWFARLGNVVQ